MAGEKSHFQLPPLASCTMWVKLIMKDSCLFSRDLISLGPQRTPNEGFIQTYPKSETGCS